MQRGSKRVLSKSARLAWLVKSRSHNQQTSYKLYHILSDRKLKRTPNAAATGIALTAVSFSLWRSVFLADRLVGYGDSFDHALSFLETLIADNAISYAQDKRAREWTFLYYLNNARLRLEFIVRLAPDILPRVKDNKNASFRETWEDLQASLDLAVENLARALRKTLK